MKPNAMPPVDLACSRLPFHRWRRAARASAPHPVGVLLRLMRVFIMILCLLPVAVVHAAGETKVHAAHSPRTPKGRDSYKPGPRLAPPDSAREMETIAVVGARLTTEGMPEVRMSSVGIGSLYWAARNPAQAWQILTPLNVRGQSAAAADIRVRCEIVAATLPGGLACP